MHMQEKILNLPASTISSIHRSVLKERMMRDNDPKIDPQTEDPTNAGGSKNAGGENKINKTEENKTKRDRGNKNENMTKHGQGL